METFGTSGEWNGVLSKKTCLKSLRQKLSTQRKLHLSLSSKNTCQSSTRIKTKSRMFITAMAMTANNNKCRVLPANVQTLQRQYKALCVTVPPMEHASTVVPIRIIKLIVLSRGKNVGFVTKLAMPPANVQCLSQTDSRPLRLGNHHAVVTIGNLTAQEQ